MQSRKKKTTKKRGKSMASAIYTITTKHNILADDFVAAYKAFTWNGDGDNPFHTMPSTLQAMWNELYESIEQFCSIYGYDVSFA